MALTLAVPGVVLAIALAIALAGDAPSHPRPRELIRDPRFQAGFHLLDPKPGQRLVYGRIAPPGSTGEPAWDLAQWNSRFPLAPSPALRPTPRTVQWTNEAKALRLGNAAPGGPDLALAVEAAREYDGRARQPGEPWVHLLAEQRFTDPPTLADLAGVRLRIEARLVRSALHRTTDYTPGLHAAQFQLFLTLQNQDRASPGFGRLVWFGVPLYDDRAPIPPEHKQRDTAGSDMFIFTPAGSVYSRRSAHDREWISVDHELRPLLDEALETAWSRGFLTESRNRAHYRLTSVNLGWEVPGLFDVEMEVRGLSLVVQPRATTP